MKVCFASTFLSFFFSFDFIYLGLYDQIMLVCFLTYFSQDISTASQRLISLLQGHVFVQEKQISTYMPNISLIVCHLQFSGYSSLSLNIQVTLPHHFNIFNSPFLLFVFPSNFSSSATHDKHAAQQRYYYRLLDLYFFLSFVSFSFEFSPCCLTFLVAKMQGCWENYQHRLSVPSKPLHFLSFHL